MGPFLICCWYRPPCRGDFSCILALQDEYLAFSLSALGVFIVGDMNVHQIKWLLHSRRNSPEGFALETFCKKYGLHECVRKPTRGKNLLDLILTDMEQVKADVLPAITDHLCTQVCFSLKIIFSQDVLRDVWCFGQADYRLIRRLCEVEDWRILESCDPSEGALFFQAKLLSFMSLSIPKKQFLIVLVRIHGLINVVWNYYLAK